MDCWPLEVDLKETSKLLFIACRLSIICMNLDMHIADTIMSSFLDYMEQKSKYHIDSV